MLSRKPNRRRKANRKSSDVPAIESVEDRVLLSAVSMSAPDVVEMESVEPTEAANLAAEDTDDENRRNRRGERRHRHDRMRTDGVDAGETISDETESDEVDDQISDDVTEDTDAEDVAESVDAEDSEADQTDEEQGVDDAVGANETDDDNTEAVEVIGEADPDTVVAEDDAEVILTSLDVGNTESQQAVDEDTSASTVSKFASIDGSGNNLDNPELGSVDTELLRLADADYADGLSSPSGEDRPSAREISNVIAAVESSETNDRYLTDIFWIWGQFIDHDIDLTESAVDEDGNALESFPIEVPAGDAFFDPAGTGDAVINLDRAAFVDGEDGVREQINQITAFIDGSVIYGSDEERAHELRTFEGGLLKTSEGDLLPYNEAGLENAGGSFDSLFLAGDVRANENAALSAMHTIWVREHNRIATELPTENPDLTDEEIYQQARQVVAAELQAITFNEFLPALFGTDAISDYEGYDSTVDPSIANEFSTAAYRFGHTLLSSELLRLDENGDVADEGNLALLNAFFNTSALEENGVDSILRGATVQVAQELDNEVVDDIRNFLFGATGSDGFDLASLNIQRGRDHGLADYNSTRVALGLAAVESFSDISSDPEVAAKLEELYGDVDNIDLWVGGLAEDHVPGSSMGETFSTIIIDQFERLRDGDRFWYENVFSGDELAEIDGTSLADVIERNSGISDLQESVFFAPTVARVDLGELESDDVTVRAADGNLEIVDNRSGTVVSSQALADMERVMLVGLNGQSDRIVIEGLTESDLPGGISVEGGNDGGDTLVVGGTEDADTIVVSNSTIDVNGMTMEVTGIRRVIVQATDGMDSVDIADDVNFRVDVVDGQQNDGNNDGRNGRNQNRRRERDDVRRRDRRDNDRQAVQSEDALTVLDQMFLPDNIDNLLRNAERRRR